MSVTLINVFSVPEEKAGEFSAWWDEIKDELSREPGFVSGIFYRSIQPNSGFNFINVAIWDDADTFTKAITKVVDPKRSAFDELGATMTPGLFTTVTEY